MSFSPWDTSALPANVTASESDYRLTRSGGTDDIRIVSHLRSKASGKYALRLLVSRSTANGAPAVGFISSNEAAEQPFPYLGRAENEWAFWGDEAGGANETAYNANLATDLGSLANFSTDQEVMIELDLDNGRVWFGADGVWAAGDPSAGTGATYTNVSGTITPAVDMYHEGSVKLLQPGEFTTAATSGFTAGWPDDWPSAIISVPSMLGSPGAFVLNDWTGIVPELAQTYYAAELQLGGDSERLPISSWQATVQADRSSYLLAVVPAAAALMDRITALADGDLVVYRGVRLDSGDSEIEMARVPLGEATYQRGPQRATVSLSGYGSISFADSGAGVTRTLTGLRSVATQGGFFRVRADIDWLLRPGMTASADGQTFTVSYINYYVTRGQSYMDVGERAL